MVKRHFELLAAIVAQKRKFGKSFSPNNSTLENEARDLIFQPAEKTEHFRILIAFISQHRVSQNDFQIAAKNAANLNFTAGNAIRSRALWPKFFLASSRPI